MARTIDDIERVIRAQYPEMRHILVEAQRVGETARTADELAV